MNALADKLFSMVSVTPVCPRCKQVIPSEDVNVANDVAFCRRCDLSHRLSALTSGAVVDEDVDTLRPPAGAWFHQDGAGVQMGATHRSLGQAVGLLFITLFWNGIISVFVSLAAVSTLHHLGVTPPHWFHQAKGGLLPIPMTIFLWIFLLPFIGIGLLLLGAFLSSLGGKTELRIARGECEIFTGIGPLGSRKRISVSEVKDVRMEENNTIRTQGSARRNFRIVVETGSKPIYFGTMLTDARRRFLAGAAKKELVRH